MPSRSNGKENMDGISDPPTEKQLERIHALLDHPGMGEWLYEMGDQFDRLLASKKGAGVLIGMMKKKVNAS